MSAVSFRPPEMVERRKTLQRNKYSYLFGAKWQRYVTCRGHAATAAVFSHRLHGRSPVLNQEVGVGALLKGGMAGRFFAGVLIPVMRYAQFLARQVTGD